MLEVVSSSQFKKDVKRLKKANKNIDRLKTLIGLLAAEAPIPPEYKDHPLVGNWRYYRDCHIEPDWLLIYRINSGELNLARTGSHSEQFGK